MISIVAKFVVKEGEESNFLELATPLVIASQAEEGCIEYILHKDTKEARTYCMIEKWKDQAAIDFHNNAPHFISTVPKLKELAQIEVNIYEPV